MLCAKYDYKMDIAVKQEEAFEDGKEAGLAEGAQQNAIETARKLKENGISVEIISKCTGLSINEVESL